MCRPGHAAFPTSATGDALVSGLETSGRLLVNSTTEGGISGELSTNLNVPHPLRRGSSAHSASSVINEVIAESLPNVDEFRILDNLMFDNTINWEGLSAEVLGAAMQKMSRDNHFSLNDIPRKCRELCESTQYWAVDPDGRGGISEAFAKRLFEFVEYEEGKLFLFFFTRCSFPLAGICADLEFEVAYRAVMENNVCLLWLIVFIRISGARRRANLVRNMEIAELQSIFQNVQCIPSVSGGAGVTSRCAVHGASGGRVVDSTVRLSPLLGNVSGEELLASSSHQASTQVADLSASRLLEVTGANATSSLWRISNYKLEIAQVSAKFLLED